MKYNRFEDLPVWNAAIELKLDIDDLCEQRSVIRRKNWIDQIDRASLSISNNIAEGFERGTTNELLMFLYIARGSAGEVRSMLRLLDRKLQRAARRVAAEWQSEISNLRFQISFRRVNRSRDRYTHGRCPFRMATLKDSGISPRTASPPGISRNVPANSGSESAANTSSASDRP